MAKTILAQDTVSGKEGRLILTIDGIAKEVAGVRNFTLTTEITYEEVEQVGTTVIQQKEKSIKHNVSMEIYYGTSEFAKIAQEYQDKHIMPNLNAIVENDDKSAANAGTQRTAVYGIKLASIPVIILDYSQAATKQTVSGTAESFKLLESFKSFPAYEQ